MLEVEGPYGRAERVPEVNYNDPVTQISGWVITGAIWHPLWSQYYLGAVSLAESPGAPPPVFQFPGATHEIIVMALNPDHGPYEAERVGEDQKLGWLEPINICEQVVATDEIVREICEGLVTMVVNGLLNPETSDAPTSIREQWSGVISRSIDHYRDPHHGHLN